jgi:hypothetical protein
MAIFFRLRSFAAERDEPELILAIYMWSLSAPIRAKKAIFSAFESAPWVPSAVEPACGATKLQLRQPPRTGRKGESKCEKWCNSGAFFALFLLRFCMLALLFMLSR